MFNRLTVILVLICILLMSCTNNKKETRGNETVISVSTEDDKMNEIIDNARKSIDQFIKALEDPQIDKFEASVKYPFETDPGNEIGIEHIWLTNISIENGIYYGLVANEPFYVSSIKLGDKVKFDINKISDWKYLKDGYLYGGKSIKYFYDQMSESDKREFDSQVNYNFKE